MQEFPVLLRFQRRGLSLSLKHCPYRRCFTLSAPRGTPRFVAKKFLQRSQAWMASQEAKLGVFRPLKAGDTLRLFEREYGVLDDALRERGLWLDGAHLWIGGGDVVLPEIDALSPGLSAHIHTTLSGLVHTYAQKKGRSVRRVILKETISRWGSCASDGTITLSWRLALAPLAVAHYVCAHEACHLLEMNHSRAFWAHVQDLRPDFQGERGWLKKHGHTLYGQIPVIGKKEAYFSYM